MFAWFCKTKKITPTLLVSKIGYDENQSLSRNWGTAMWSDGNIFYIDFGSRSRRICTRDFDTVIMSTYYIYRGSGLVLNNHIRQLRAPTTPAYEDLMYSGLFEHIQAYCTHKTHTSSQMHTPHTPRGIWKKKKTFFSLSNGIVL